MPSADFTIESAAISSAELRVVLEAVTGTGQPRRIVVEGGSCLIGCGDFCDLQLTGEKIPLAHSELHIEQGAIWIESTDEHDLEINGSFCRRLALRAGDRLRLGETVVTLLINPADEVGVASHTLQEDLSQLSALELCERIEAEQAAVAEFERRRLMGWDALLTQLEDLVGQEPPASIEHEARIEGVLAQLHVLSETLAARTQELASQEAQFLESAGDLKQAQHLMTTRLEELLQQFKEGELRASA